MIFTEAAVDDMAMAIAFYDAQETGLGMDLAREIKEACHRIMDFPEAWPTVGRITRRCQTNRFPYAVYYEIQADGIVRVVAILSLRRKARNWK